MRHCTKSYQNRSYVYRDIAIKRLFFQNGGRLPSWIFLTPNGTTLDDHLMVSIVVQNSVEIDAVVSIT